MILQKWDLWNLICGCHGSHMIKWVLAAGKGILCLLPRALIFPSNLPLWLRPDFHVLCYTKLSLSHLKKLWALRTIEHPSIGQRRHWHLEMSFSIAACGLWKEETGKGWVKDTERACLPGKRPQKNKGDSSVQWKPGYVAETSRVTPSLL